MSKSQKGSVVRPWWQEVLSLGMWAFFFLFFMPSFLWQPFRIPSSSMEGTLLVGDYIFVSKYAYGYSKYSTFPLQLFDFGGRVWAAEPKRGDVIVFRHPLKPNDDPYIKRLVGLPGDTVQMAGGVLYINRQAVGLKPLGTEITNCPFSNSARPAEVFEETLPGGRSHRVINCMEGAPLDSTPEMEVPAGHYFFVGDNRDNSGDSRVPASEGGIGFVPRENLMGRAEVIFQSIEPGYQWWEVWRWPLAIRFGRLLNSLS